MKDIEDLENEIEIQRNENSPTIKMPEIKGMRKIVKRDAITLFIQHKNKNS